MGRVKVAEATMVEATTAERRLLKDGYWKDMIVEKMMVGLRDLCCNDGVWARSGQGRSCSAQARQILLGCLVEASWDASAISSGRHNYNLCSFSYLIGWHVYEEKMGDIPN